MVLSIFFISVRKRKAVKTEESEAYEIVCEMRAHSDEVTKCVNIDSVCAIRRIERGAVGRNGPVNYSPLPVIR